MPDSLSIRHQCELLELNRSSLYYEPVLISKETLNIMTRIDEIYTAYPFYGSRKITIALKEEGLSICRERVQKLMRQMTSGKGRQKMMDVLAQQQGGRPKR